MDDLKAGGMDDDHSICTSYGGINHECGVQLSFQQGRIRMEQTELLHVA
jgi:hypothetical protein